jgi:predicted enzyme related to lactoylglutathione lyase
LHNYDTLTSIFLEEKIMEPTNTFCWVDIPVIDLDRAIQFYGAVLNEPIQKISEHGFEFGLLPHVQNNVSGCLSVMQDRKPSKDGTLAYLNLEGRLDEALEAVQKQGGTVLKAKEQMGPYGHRAIIIDTEGNAVALYSKAA